MGREEILATIHKAAQSWEISDDLAAQAKARNGWFTQKNVSMAVNHWKSILTPENLSELANRYPDNGQKEAVVGIVMAGNIPLVGLHDLLCALIAGYKVSYKPSSDDEVLMDYAVESMVELNPSLKERITKADRMNEVDRVIATGSDNTARYFDFYFRDIPHLIRKNRSSVAVLTGEESDEELRLLGQDVFSYFGKGCRNVSAVFLPDEESLQRLLKALDSYGNIANHHKYHNNYTYHKAIWLMNSDPFYDTGAICVKESEEVHSPLGTLYFNRYASLDDVKATIHHKRGEIQSVVGRISELCDMPFGESILPPLTWFADNIDTLKFLTNSSVETA